MMIRMIESVELSAEYTLDFYGINAAVLCCNGAEVAEFESTEAGVLYLLLVNAGAPIGWEELYNKALRENRAQNPQKSVQDTVYGIKKKLAPVLELPEEQHYIDFPRAARGSGAYCIRINAEYIHYSDDGVYQLGDMEYRLNSHLEVAPYCGANYIERPELEQALQQLAAQHRIVFLSGVGGIGKSELARRYAAQQKASGAAEVVLQLEYKEGAAAFYRSVESCDSGKYTAKIFTTERVTGRQALSEQEQQQIKLELMARAQKNVLILVHNYDVPDAGFLRDLQQQTGAARIIVTTRLNNSAETAAYGPLLDVDDFNAQQADFACRVFCRYANLPLPPYRDAVLSVVSKVGGHTLMAELLGRYIDEIADGSGSERDIRGMLDDLNRSLKTALEQVDGLFYRKDGRDVLAAATVYGILKELFKSLWNTAFTAMERQIFGALVLLPPAVCRKERLTLLLGDAPEHNSRQAIRALNGLIRRGFVQAKDQQVALHPLIEELVCDPLVGGVYNDAIAETSAAFLLHLLNNAFVADEELLEWALDFADAYIENFGEEELAAVPDADLGWAMCWELCGLSCAEQRQRLLQLINANHAALGVAERADAAAVERLLREPWLSFTMEHQHGRSLWLLNDTSKEAWCIINLSGQRLPQHRCFGSSKEPQHSGVARARLCGCSLDYDAATLFVPERLYGIPVTAVGGNWGSNSSLTTVCLPPQLKQVEDCAFMYANQLRQVFFTGNQLHSIGAGAFMQCGKLAFVLFPRQPFLMQKTAFSCCTALANLLLPPGTKFAVETTAVDLLENAALKEVNAVLEQHVAAQGIKDPNQLMDLVLAFWAQVSGINGDDDDDEFTQQGKELAQLIDAEKLTPLLEQLKTAQEKVIAVKKSCRLKSPQAVQGELIAWPFGDLRPVMLHYFDEALELKVQGELRMLTGAEVARANTATCLEQLLAKLESAEDIAAAVNELCAVDAILKACIDIMPPAQGLPLYGRWARCRQKLFIEVTE